MQSTLRVRRDINIHTLHRGSPPWCARSVVSQALIGLLLGCSILYAQTAAAEDVIIYSYFGQISHYEEIKDYLSFMAAGWPRKHLFSGRLKKVVQQTVSITAGPKEEPEADLYTQMKELMMLTVVEGQFEQAAPKLNRIKAKYSNQFLQRISHQVYRSALSRADVLLAFIDFRTNRLARARERIKRLIMDYPQWSPSTVEFPSMFVSLYVRTRRALRQKASGALSVRTTPKGCTVFLNERYIGISPVKVGDLIPGTYRLYTQKDQRRGRVHFVEVKPGINQVAIDLDHDDALKTEPTVTLQFETRSKMKTLVVAYAAELLRRLDRERMVVFMLSQCKAHLCIRGLVVTQDDTITRTGTVVFGETGPPTRALIALQRFLASGTEHKLVLSEAFVPRSKGREVTAIQAESSPSMLLSVLKWSCMGLSLAFIGAGIAAYAVHGEQTCDRQYPNEQCPKVTNSATLGTLSLIAGGLFGGASGLFFYWDAKQRASVYITPTVQASYVGLSTTFRF